MKECEDPLKALAGRLFEFLRDIIYKSSAEPLDIESLPKEFVEFGRGLQYVANLIFEAKAFAKELANGNLNCTPPPPNNEIASSLKMLHSSLMHLTWQTQQVAKGDYNQCVDFMGDFSKAFNYMIEQLRHRHKKNLNEKYKLEMYIQLLLENSPNPILLFTKDGKLVLTSYSFFRLFNVFKSVNVMGKDISELLGQIASEETVKTIGKLYFRAIAENTTLETEQEIYLNDRDASRYFWIQITPMLDEDKEHLGVIIFLIDMTDSIQARRDVENARKLAEQSSRAKTIFLAKMSHEIRTPMNAIIGMTELALRDNLPLTAMEHILTIKHAGVNLISIINDILEFTKIESGKMEIIPNNYLIASLINDVVSIIRMRVIDSRVRFVVNVDNEIPSMLFGDVSRIRQVLLNILNNAVKYTKNGFVSFTVVGEKMGENTINLVFEVMDSGVGIKQKNLDALFEEFTQFDSARDSYTEGTGLGLAITRNIIEAMGGEIKVQSEYHTGSIFTVTLPQKFDSSEKIASIDNPEKINVLVYEHRDIYACSIICTIDSLGVYCEIALNDTEFFQKIENNSYSFIFISYALYINAKEKLQELGDKTKIVLLAGFGEMVADTKLKILAMPVHCISVANILNGTGDNSTWGTNLGIYSWFTAPTANVLVVDDINTNLSVVEGLLLPYKMQVDTCESGELALEMVAEKNYDLIFMDHMMPVMDGVEATFRIRKMSEKDPHYKELPIIALTANAVSGSREMFQENGFSDFLSKPIDTIQLNAILEKWIPKEKQIGSAEGAVGETSESLNAVESGGNFEIEGLNAAAGIKIVGGSLKTYLSTLGIFYRDGNKKILEIAKCLEANDLSLYTIFIHALKGACANIGAEKLSGAARILEIAGTKRDLNFVLANNSIFIANLEALLFKINEFLAIKAEESKNIVLDRELLNAGLSGLKTALVSFDSAEIKKAVSVLREFSHAADVGPAVENILRNVLTGDYDEAVELINSIM